MKPICLTLLTHFCALLVFGISQAGAADITGTVKSSETFVPLPGALVSLQATGVKTIADENGNFSLTVPTGNSHNVTAAYKGYYTKLIQTAAPASGATIALEAVPAADDESYELLEPSSCALCHPDQLEQWLDTPMAKAGSNTWVHDIYSGKGTTGGMGGFVYKRDSKFAHHNPASECASCHQPESWIAEPFSALQDPSPTPTSAVVHGISCEVCHKIANVDTTKINFPGIFPGAVEFTRPADEGHQVQYGALGDVSYQAYGMMRSSYQPQLVAEVCAACHQDATDLAGDHSYTGPISEGTYLEWKNSPYSDPESPHFATCVDCHMPATDTDLMCSYGLPRDPDTIRSHTIEGTTPAFLENALDLGIDASIENGKLRISVDVTNSKTGHHVPSGVTIRNVILLINAVRQEDQQRLTHVGQQTVHAIGGVGDPETGNFAGQAGKLYAKVIHDKDDNFPAFFTDATGFVFDSRIPPLAMDHTDYEFLLPPGGGTLQVQARLIYRRAHRVLVDAKQWTTDGHGNPLEDLAAPHFGHLMEMEERSITVAALAINPGSSSDELVLSWPLFGEGSIEQSVNPNGPWIDLSGELESNGWLQLQRVPNSGDRMFFRFLPIAAEP